MSESTRPMAPLYGDAAAPNGRCHCGAEAEWIDPPECDTHHRERVERERQAAAEARPEPRGRCPSCPHDRACHTSGGMCDGDGSECYCVRFPDSPDEPAFDPRDALIAELREALEGLRAYWYHRDAPRLTTRCRGCNATSRGALPVHDPAGCPVDRAERALAAEARAVLRRWEAALHENEALRENDPSFYGEEMDGFNMTERNADGTVAEP